ncbi:Sentrin-specific protease 7 [Seminavis robusta]|uniref:Sentrin-specific protease 7 n=1 Tax=Seminavis robusta TaxID=568900 RepID=A0A9N8DP80_9STRA|nr:Sentrin-specific protease 7 [Seminavis robusta]|eukprot:Sro272_g104850.1 Sentrin-specific protease 7 (1216) ;mRNA; f:38305-42184
MAGHGIARVQLNRDKGPRGKPKKADTSADFVEPGGQLANLPTDLNEIGPAKDDGGRKAKAIRKGKNNRHCTGRQPAKGDQTSRVPKKQAPLRNALMQSNNPLDQAKERQSRPRQHERPRNSSSSQKNFSQSRERRTGGLLDSLKKGPRGKDMPDVAEILTNLTVPESESETDQENARKKQKQSKPNKSSRRSYIQHQEGRGREKERGGSSQKPAPRQNNRKRSKSSDGFLDSQHEGDQSSRRQSAFDNLGSTQKRRKSSGSVLDEDPIQEYVEDEVYEPPKQPATKFGLFQDSHNVRESDQDESEETRSAFSKTQIQKGSRTKSRVASQAAKSQTYWCESRNATQPSASKKTNQNTRRQSTTPKDTTRRSSRLADEAEGSEESHKRSSRREPSKTPDPSANDEQTKKPFRLTGGKVGGTANKRKRKSATPISIGATFSKAKQTEKSLRSSESKQKGRHPPATVDLPDNRRETRAATRQRKKKPGKQVVIHLTDSDEDDDEPVEAHDVQKDVECIAVGTKLFEKDCRIEVSNELVLALKGRKRKVKKKDGDDLITCIDLNGKDLKCLKFFSREESLESNLEPFLALQVAPNDQNKLGRFGGYGYNSKDKRQNYIVIQFRSNDDLEAVLGVMGSTHPFVQEAQLSSEEAEHYCAAILNGKGFRRGKVTDAFIGNRSEDDVLLVYPFAGDADEIEHCASELQEASGELFSENPACAATPVDDGKVSSSPEATDLRRHKLTVRVRDVERLNPGVFLNDTLIDFWIQWITRKAHQDPSGDMVHCFSSHFFTTLDDEGPDAVTKWTARRNIDIFKKKFIFIPINEALHWSLCVVVNPGSVLEEADDQPMACMIFLDSLKAHSKSKVSKTVRKWLTSEWKRLKPDSDNKDPFLKLKRFPLLSPEIPYQNNSWDCGVFVCRYAYSMYALRGQPFNRGNQWFAKNLIDNEYTKCFSFRMGDIARLRLDILKLVGNLSGIYLRWKKLEEEQDKVASRALKAKTEGASEQGEAAIDKAEATTEDDCPVPTCVTAHPGRTDPSIDEDSAVVTESSHLPVGVEADLHAHEHGTDMMPSFNADGATDDVKDPEFNARESGTVASSHPGSHPGSHHITADMDFSEYVDGVAIHHDISAAAVEETATRERLLKGHPGREFSRTDATGESNDEDGSEKENATGFSDLAPCDHDDVYRRLHDEKNQSPGRTGSSVQCESRSPGKLSEGDTFEF